MSIFKTQSNNLLTFHHLVEAQKIEPYKIWNYTLKEITRKERNCPLNYELDSQNYHSKNPDTSLLCLPSKPLLVTSLSSVGWTEVSRYEGIPDSSPLPSFLNPKVHKCTGLATPTSQKQSILSSSSKHQTSCKCLNTFFHYPANPVYRTPLGSPPIFSKYNKCKPCLHAKITLA